MDFGSVWDPSSYCGENHNSTYERRRSGGETARHTHHAHATAAPAVAEQTTLEKEAWNMPGTWKRTPPPHVRFADTEQMFHSTEEMHQV
jgi:hypothetical protein